MDINSLFNTRQSLLEAKLSILIDHPVTKGDHCEGAWIDFFRSFLPNKYAVDKGFVFDSNGSVSEQIDVIIYDSLYTPLIFGTDAGEKFITAESVYAVFDSKPKIDKGTIEYTNHKIETVHNLRRTSRGMVNSGKRVPPRELTNIIGGILAVSSIGFDTLLGHLKSNVYIDVGCAPKSLSFIVQRNNNRDFLNLQSSEHEVVLSFFFIILDELYKIGTVAAIDIRDYADASLNNFKLEKGDF